MNLMIDEKYKETIRDNFLNWVKDEVKIEAENHKLEVGLMYIAWLEATRQADIRNSIK